MLLELLVAALPLAVPTHSPPTSAETTSRTVPAGRATDMGHYMGWHPDCSPLQIRIDIVTKPAHGTAWTDITEEIGTFALCTGKPVRVLKLYYEPTPGYHGPDSFGVKETSFGSPKTETFAITVK
jgi:hypothetical protein